MDIADSIMATCIEHFNKLSKGGKPKENEWTVMSSIVGAFNDESGGAVLRVLSLGTGSKCIGRSSMSPCGNILNDSHSEVIARRGFLRYLYGELMRLNKSNDSDVFYRLKDSSYRVRVKNTVKFYFATSMSPCGDASIIPKSDDELAPQLESKSMLEDNLGPIITNAVDSDCGEPVSKQMKIDGNVPKDIHRTGAKCLPSSHLQDPLLPGIDYHMTGLVRTKPGRGDPTASVSCSDKLARWNSVGVQGALLSIFIEDPVVLEMIIIGGTELASELAWPHPSHTDKSKPGVFTGGCPYSYESCNRAINQRTGGIKPVSIIQSTLVFPGMKSEKRTCPSPNALIWFHGKGADAEVSVNGLKQGTTKKNINKKSARTSLCKIEMFKLFQELVNSLDDNQGIRDKLPVRDLKTASYLEVKSKASDYYSKWDNIKNNCFKLWTAKPEKLLDFTLLED